MKFRCGTRGSKLALAQTQLVINALRQCHAGLEIERIEVKTLGDRKQDTPSASLTDKKDWIYDLELGLLNNTIDFAVHSSKDIPHVVEPGTALLPVLKRGNPCDSFVGRRSLETGERILFADLPQGAKVGTASLRRRAYLLRMRPDLDVVEFRGNVTTRIERMDSGAEVMGIILATSGIERLGFTDLVYETFTTTQMLPALNQATLAVQFRENDNAIREALQPLIDAETHATWRAERTVAEVLQGDCRSAMGIFAQCKGDQLHLDSSVMLADGTEGIEANDTGTVDQPDQLGKAVAGRLMALGAQELIEKSRKLRFR